MFWVSGLIAAAVVAYWPASRALWRYWTDEPSLGGHGMLVTVLAVWLLYRARDRIGSAVVQPAQWALVPLVLCSIASLVFWRAGIQSLQLLTLPALMWLGVFAAFGACVARVVAVPIGYLYFAMPAWNLLTVPLQHLTLRIVAWLAPMLGLPATVSGYLVTFPNGAKFEVTTACSGAVFLVQGLAVAVLLGELEQAPVGRRLRLVGSMVAVALAANWIRVLALLQIGYSTEMRHVLVSRDHLEFGWTLFVLVLLGFVWVSTRSAPSERAEPTRLVGTLPMVKFEAYLATLVIVAFAPLLIAIAAPSHDLQDERAQLHLHLPAGHATWRGPLETLDRTWSPVFVGAHDERHVAYEDVTGRNVEAIAIGYSWQEQGRELLNEGNSLLGDGGLTALTSSVVVDNGQSYREMVVRDKQDSRSIVWSFYDVGGRGFATPLFSQLWYGVRSLATPPYSTLFAFRAQCVPSCDAARATLVSFLHGTGSAPVAVTAPSS